MKLSLRGEYALRALIVLGLNADKEVVRIQTIPEKSKVLFFAADTPEVLYIKYKPAPHQKVSQQTCKPSELGVKSAKAIGNQISIKDVQSVNAKPPRNWDENATTTELKFA